VHNSIDYGAVACVGGSAFTGIPADHDLHTILSVLQKAAHDQGWKLVTRSTSEKEGKAEFICQAGRKYVLDEKASCFHERIFYLCAMPCRYRMYPKKLPPGEKGHRVTHSKCLGTCQARINLRRSVTQRGENKEATAWSAWRVTTAINTHRYVVRKPSTQRCDAVRCLSQQPARNALAAGATSSALCTRVTSQLAQPHCPPRPWSLRLHL
jgi:hypothetical protein